jgi:tRNA A37 threonylcarbamoyladenosine synthetase subunit TsaC/SUA5/YrdC
LPKEPILTQHPALAGAVRGRPDVEGDTRRMLDVLTNGGVALVPANLGYALVGSTPDANRRIIAAKRREGHKRQGIVMDAITEREIHILDQRKRDIVDCITIDYNLPLGVIAKYRKDHPLIQSLDPFLLKIGTARGTIGTALNDGGIFHEALGKYSREHLWPFLGSSANLTGQGARFRVEDIEPEIIAAADIVLDYGVCRHHYFVTTSTQINFETMEVLRMGAYYDLISDILKRHFNWEIPPDPGRRVNPSGHLQEFALVGVED